MTFTYIIVSQQAQIVNRYKKTIFLLTNFPSYGIICEDSSKPSCLKTKLWGNKGFFCAHTGAFFIAKGEFMNELLLIGSLLIIYAGVILAYRLFGKAGLFAFTAIATVVANIEVLILIDGFGMEQTLGNVMFASTYLVTDILSENEGKKDAARAVYIGIFTAAAVLVFSQYWFLFTPSANDWVMPSIKQIFSQTPRLLLASFLGYAVSQRLDVWLYHKWWALTSRKKGDTRAYLWLRNNGSTLISQIINTLIFNLIAFAGKYSTGTLISIVVSSYVIYFFTSLLDTPIVYLARSLKEKGKIPN